MAWSGLEMIVWGGRAGEPYVNTGMRYNPVTDSWAAMTTASAPAERANHSAVWADNAMLAWGGENPYPLDSGSAYAPPSTVDDDGDGFAGCEDCADTDPGAHAPPAEIGNLQWPASGSSLSWDSDAGSGPATVYDVLYGDLGSVSSFGPGPADACLGNNTPSLVITDGSTAPAPGMGWFFLVRGENTCGKGRYETATSGDDRLATACP